MGSSHTPFPLDQPCLVALNPRLIIVSEHFRGEWSEISRSSNSLSEADNNETNQAPHDLVRGDGRVPIQTGSRSPDSGISPPDAIA